MSERGRYCRCTTFRNCVLGCFRIWTYFPTQSWGLCRVVENARGTTRQIHHLVRLLNERIDDTISANKSERITDAPVTDIQIQHTNSGDVFMSANC